MYFDIYWEYFKVTVHFGKGFSEIDGHITDNILIWSLA